MIVDGDWLKRGVFCAVLGVGCMAHPPAAVPPPDFRQLTILPSRNATGTELAISGDPVLEAFLGRPRRTVGEYMAAKAAALLAGRGYAVTSTRAGVPALRFAIEDWEVDVAAFEFAVVTVSARLTRDEAAAPLWTTRRVRWVVPTRGAVSVMGARRLAADYIVDDLLAPWPRADRIAEGTAP